MKGTAVLLFAMVAAVAAGSVRVVNSVEERKVQQSNNGRSVNSKPEPEAEEAIEFLSNGCPANPEILSLVRDESECGSFYYCISGTNVLRICPEGLQFNADIQEMSSSCSCNCNCNSNGRNNNNKNDGLLEPEVEEAIEFLSNGCPANPEILWRVPDESECGSFYYCVNGTKVSRICPEGLQFNADIQERNSNCNCNCNCNSNGRNNNNKNSNNEPRVLEIETPVIVELLEQVAAVAADSVRVVYGVEERKVQQSNNGRPVNSKPERPEPEAEEAIEFLSNGCPANPEIHWLVPDESECSSFYYCISGTKLLRICPEGLQFNADIQEMSSCSCNCNCNGRNNNNEVEEAIEFLSNGCPANPEILWRVPDESECGSFHYCVNGTKVSRICPEGLQFNADIQERNSNCNCNCNCNSNSNQRPESEPEAEEDNEFLSNGCPANPEIHWLVPDESECSSFYECVNGTKVLFSCPEGLQFNADIQVCDWPENVQCTSNNNNNNNNSNNGPRVLEIETPVIVERFLEQVAAVAADSVRVVYSVEERKVQQSNNGRPVNSKPETPEPEAEEAIEFLSNGCPANPEIHWLVPDESECGSFYYCVSGTKVLRSCPEGLQFNADIQVCDWPENVQCKSNNNNNNGPSNNRPNNNGSNNNNNNNGPNNNGSNNNNNNNSRPKNF